MSEHIALADVFVNLSVRSSDVDQSLLEAMAQGKVIIGSEVSPLSTVVEDGVDGFLIRPADTVTLAELILQTFNHQLNATEIGEKARQKVLNLFDSKKMIHLTLDAYDKTLKRVGHHWTPPTRKNRVCHAAQPLISLEMRLCGP